MHDLDLVDHMLKWTNPVIQPVGGSVKCIILISKKSLIIIGPIVHSITPEKLTIEENAVIGVKDGKISVFVTNGDVESVKIAVGICDVYVLEAGQFLCPGLIDLHIHAPQFPNAGLGYDMPLLDWLDTYTLPLEMRYKDADFAENIYNYVVNTTLKCGTTTACYFGTIYKNSTEKLAQIISDKGQRALVGKVNMNQNSVDGYCESTEVSLEKTMEFIKFIKQLNNPLVEPVVSPRFAISCDMHLMESLGKIAQEQGLYVQTHIGENKSEVEFVKELFPDCSSYAAVYNKANLLTKKTILAHGVYLTEDECKLVSSKGSCVAHCPNSNTVLRSGLCSVRRLWKHGIKVGLGTDVAGGSNPSIINAMQCALATSMHISFNEADSPPLSYHEVFYLATLGGAKALGKDAVIGNFLVGKDFDGLVVDMEIGKSTSGALNEHSTSEIVQKFIYSGDDRNVKKVFVKGKLVSK